MLCLDTYALVEIWKANPKFSAIFNQNFVITDTTMAEFYIFLYKNENENIAIEWHNKLSPYCQYISRDILIKALKYTINNKKENLSVFDCISYIYALENNIKFVTGDKFFEDKEGVLFIQK
ncbi:MAG: PIN domain-containing protein [Nanoarchaeota archaeon]